MTELGKALDDYLAVRRALGVELRLCGRLLKRFVEFMEEKGAPFITTGLALQWATQPKDAQRSQWANRLGMVRRFAEYLSATDPRTEIPAAEHLPYRYHRKPPYIYTNDEVLELINAAKKLPSPRGLRAQTHSTLFGLIAVTGMRINEPLRLDRGDVDFKRGILTVRKTKFDKSRLIPIHSSTKEKLLRYARRRDRVCPNPKSQSFFLTERGTRLKDWTVRRWFVILSRQIGLRGPEDRRGPRIHDLRHGFAIKTLMNWYRAGADVDQLMPTLTTYLGHGHVADTYWYISAAPELLQLATHRLEESKRRLSL
jgi:integrase